MKKSIVFFGLMLFSVMSFAAIPDGPAFDCNKASITAEHLICGNDYLSQMDEIVAHNYKSLLEAGANVKVDQLNWLKERNLCTDENCLIFSYKSRNALLASMLESRNIYALTDDGISDNSNDQEETNNEPSPTVTQSPTPPYKLMSRYNYNENWREKQTQYYVVATVNNLVINQIVINDGGCNYPGRVDNRPLKMGQSVVFNILDQVGGCTVIKLTVYTNHGNYTHTLD